MRENDFLSVEKIDKKAKTGFHGHFYFHKKHRSRVGLEVLVGGLGYQNKRPKTPKRPKIKKILLVRRLGEYDCLC